MENTIGSELGKVINFVKEIPIRNVLIGCGIIIGLNIIGAILLQQSEEAIEQEKSNIRNQKMNQEVEKQKNEMKEFMGLLNSLNTK